MKQILAIVLALLFSKNIFAVDLKAECSKSSVGLNHVLVANISNPQLENLKIEFNCSSKKFSLMASDESSIPLHFNYGGDSGKITFYFTTPSNIALVVTNSEPNPDFSYYAAFITPGNWDWRH